MLLSLGKWLCLLNVGVYMHMCAYACECQRTMSGILTYFLCETWSRACMLSKISVQPVPGIPCFCLPSARTAGVLHT